MAKIVMTAWGTRGDCQAIATVGGALAHRGHEVRLAAPGFMEPEAARLGVGFSPMGDDPLAWFEEKPSRRQADPRRSMPALLRLFARQVDRQFDDLSGLVAEADIVVGQALTYAAPSLADAHHLPYVYLSPNVFFFDSAHHPSLGINRAGMPAWVNRLTWKQFSITYNLMFRRKINRHRAQRGLAPISDARTHVFDAGRTIAILDPELYPVPVDVSLPRPPVGSIPVPSDGVVLDEATAAFLDGPRPLVFVDFGSMPDRDPRTTSAAIVTAARSVGARVILSAGWAGLGEGVSPARDVHVVRGLPHSMVLPRVDAFVHHGGVGTAATAARAGVVQVVVPHGYDQHASARCLRTAGVATEPLPRRRLDATALADRLGAAITDSEVRTRAAELAQVISSRDSLESTVVAIEEALAA